MKLPRLSLRPVPATILVTLLLAGCATNPVTGKREFSLVSEGQELEMGRQGDEAAVAEFGLYDNPALAAYVDRVGQKLARASERADLAWHFRVLDSPVVNAFALPGGYIFITRGLLASLNSEAQLAGVLGHEIGHVTARHSARHATQQQLAGLGLGLGSALIGGFDRYAGVASQGLGLLFLKFSRDDETQADELGVKYVTQADYDPREMPATYEMLKLMSQREGGSIPTFLSTHPDPGDREVRTRELADAAIRGKSGALAVLRPDYKKQLTGLVYGSDPRQGYLDGARFYHPEMSFQVDFPAGWKVENARTAVTARTSQGDAGVQLTVVKWDGTNPTGYPDALRQQGRIASASGEFERIAGYAAWVGTVMAPDGQGGTQSLLAAWILRQQGSLFQFMGAPASDAQVRQRFVDCVRSFRDLRDAQRLNVQPARFAVRSAPAGLTLGAWLAKSPEGRLSAEPPEVAWLNGIEENAVPTRGDLIKLPRVAP
jgi:predicted Zn-dependent protease